MAEINLKILLLAAGKSARMGKPKQLLPVAETTLIELAIKTALNAKVAGLYCVLGANYDKIREKISKYPVEIVENIAWEIGLGKSIAVGTSAVLKNEPETEGILILLSDQPGVDSLYLEKMISTFEDRPGTIIVSDYSGFYGVPAIFPTAYFDQLQELNEDNGAKELLNSGKLPIIAVKSPEKLGDIDTPADYEQFLKSQNQ